MRYLRMSTILVFGFGVIAIIGGLTEFGPLAVLLGLMMIVSGVVKIIALRIMENGSQVPGGSQHSE